MAFLLPFLAPAIPWFIDEISNLWDGTITANTLNMQDDFDDGGGEFD